VIANLNRAAEKLGGTESERMQTLMRIRASMAESSASSSRTTCPVSGAGSGCSALGESGAGCGGDGGSVCMAACWRKTAI